MPDTDKKVKITSDDLAKFINNKLLKHNEHVDMDDILKDFLESNEDIKKYVESELVDKYAKYGYKEDEKVAMFRKEFSEDLIKHAKQKLRNALREYGLDFDTDKRKFRYPDNLDFDPMADGAAKKIRIDKSEIIYNYQKSLLKCLDLAIQKKQVVSFDYMPAYDAESHKVVFHPHYIKEYNGRKFVFGDEKIVESASGEKTDYCGKHYEQGNIAIDRIFSDRIQVLSEVKYIEPSVDYNTFFDDIVGVTHLNGEPKQLIKIKTNNQYIHGILLTKPIHKSQVEIKEFDGTSGEFTIKVCFNKELLGALFHFEGNIEITSPDNIRAKMADEVKKMYELYYGKKH